MSTESLAEILKTASELKSKKDKVEFLRAKASKPLRNILKVTYDKTMELNIPNVAPPYLPSVHPDSHGMLFRETRKLPYFVKGYDGDNIHPIRREALFIQMLEAVDPDDAKLLCDMIRQKPLKGISLAVVIESFPGLISQ
jgi:hypothetical protein|tara:strand:+ start:95 stop:514 length:420 start_codon:yes stop_codon:yes gene_type:complete